MKVINKEVDMIAIFDKEDMPKPYKFKYIAENQEQVTIKVDTVITTEKKSLLGFPILSFQCQSIINGYLRRYEIIYDIQKLKWRLFKI